MALQKYNPKRLIGSWKGSIGRSARPFVAQFDGTGYMDDTFITAKYDEDRVTVHKGADGTISIVLNANEYAQVTMTFSQGAPINTVLSRLYGSAKRNYLPVGVFNFEDLNGDSRIKAPQAWIEMVADIEFGKDIKGRQWRFGLSEAELFVGGAGDF